MLGEFKAFFFSLFLESQASFWNRGVYAFVFALVIGGQPQAQAGNIIKKKSWEFLVIVGRQPWAGNIVLQCTAFGGNVFVELVFVVGHVDSWPWLFDNTWPILLCPYIVFFSLHVSSSLPFAYQKEKGQRAISCCLVATYGHWGGGDSFSIRSRAIWFQEQWARASHIWVAASLLSLVGAWLPLLPLWQLVPARKAGLKCSWFFSSWYMNVASAIQMVPNIPCIVKSSLTAGVSVEKHKHYDFSVPKCESGWMLGAYAWDLRPCRGWIS